jgi:hypothetical protein
MDTAICRPFLFFFKGEVKAEHQHQRDHLSFLADPRHLNTGVHFFLGKSVERQYQSPHLLGDINHTKSVTWLIHFFVSTQVT